MASRVKEGNGATDLEVGAAYWKGIKLRSRPSPTDRSGPDAGADRPSHGSRAKGGSSGGAGRSPRLAPSLRSVLRRNWRRSLSATLALTLALVLLCRHRQLYQDAAAKLYYRFDPTLRGRDETLFPAPTCCRGKACQHPRDSYAGSGGGDDSSAARTSTQQQQHQRQHPRAAVVTYLRDDSHLSLLAQLDCTLRHSNPHLELGLMHVVGELAPVSLDLAQTLNITLLPVLPLDFPTTREPRYHGSWLKVRALGLVQYDMVLLLDADLAVVNPGLDALFSLPFEFAAVWDQRKWLSRFRTALSGIDGGVLLLRPCAAVEAHMVALLKGHPKLRFAHSNAVQDFFGWYYRYTGATLPLHWNCQAEECLVGGLTVGGERPTIVRYTVGSHKPFIGTQPGALGHEFLCTAQELAQRAQGVVPVAGAAPTAAAGAAGAGGEGVPVGQQQQREAGEQVVEQVATVQVKEQQQEAGQQQGQQLERQQQEKAGQQHEERQQQQQEGQQHEGQQHKERQQQQQDGHQQQEDPGGQARPLGGGDPAQDGASLEDELDASALVRHGDRDLPAH